MTVERRETLVREKGARERVGVGTQRGAAQAHTPQAHTPPTRGQEIAQAQ